MVIKAVISLCLWMGSEVIEHTYKNSIADCLKTKREILRYGYEESNYTCDFVEAEVYVDQFGKTRINKIIGKADHETKKGN